jgi:hypothetical protein
MVVLHGMVLPLHTREGDEEVMRTMGAPLFPSLAWRKRGPRACLPLHHGGEYTGAHTEIQWA